MCHFYIHYGGDEKEFLTIEPESLGSYAESHDSEIIELRDNTTPATFPSSFTQFATKSCQIPRIQTEFAMKLRICKAIVLSDFNIVDLLRISKMWALSFENISNSKGFENQHFVVNISF